MAQEWTPDHRDGLAEPQITVIVHRSGPPLPGHRARVLFVLAAVVVAVIGIAAVAGLTTGGSPGAPVAVRGAPATARGGAVPGTGGTFGYPFRCLSVAFAPNGSGVAHAYVQHGGLCNRYARYVSATFRRVDGGWRLIGR